jgi:hypothetical protein
MLFTNKDSQAGQPKNLDVGQVKGIALSGTMSGYANGAVLTISAPPTGGVQAAGTILVTAGVITGVIIVNPGAGYTSAPTVTAPVGSGAVLSASVAANLYANSEIVFVSLEESLIVSNKLKGISSPGWYRIVEKMTSAGNITYKSECLVAMTVATAVSTDGKGDDLVVGDVNIAIATQPQAQSATAPGAASFTVVGTGVTTFQWQVQVGGVGSYINVVGAPYTTPTAATLGITNSSGLNGNRYRVICGNGGTAQVTSRGASLTVA